MPILDELDEIIEFGTVSQYIEDGQQWTLLVKPKNPMQIYDIDNIVTLKDKQILGFVIDLVGHVTTPQYSVRLYPCYVQAM